MAKFLALLDLQRFFSGYLEDFFVLSWPESDAPSSGRAEELMSGLEPCSLSPRAELPQGLKSPRTLLQFILHGVAVTPFRQVEK